MSFHRPILTIAASALLASAALPASPTMCCQNPVAPRPPTKPNILVVLMDDLGVDPLISYTSLLGSTWGGSCSFASPSTLPCLDVLDELARHGVVFTEAWANPTCSATRATVLTGRYGFRTGIGKMIRPGSGDALCDAESFIPEVIGATHTSGAFGKWHLTSASDPFSSTAEGYPWVNGFDLFEGQLHAVLAPYCTTTGSPTWLEVESSPTLVEQPPDLTNYLIEEHIRDATAWIQTAPEPWFCYLAPQGPFQAYQWPPMQYGPCSPISTGDECNKVEGGTAAKRAAYDATLEAQGIFLRDLLDQLDVRAAQVDPSFHWWDTTSIIFLGDNGTPMLAARKPFGPSNCKETLFEGGVRVPFVIAGWGVDPARQGDHCSELVNSVDVFTTVCSLAGAALPNIAIDGVNLRPYLRRNPASGLRSFAYAEMWKNSEGPCWEGGPIVDRVYRSATCGVNWKIHFSRTKTSTRFYDLASDPCEQSPYVWDDPAVAAIQDCLWNEVSVLVNAGTCDNLCQ